jgi:type VI secretion system protein ImpF
MTNSYLKERLQPALLDRLADDLGHALTLLAESRQRLETGMDADQRTALATLLDAERLPADLSSPEIRKTPLARLDTPSGDLLIQVISLERMRRAELGRHAGLSAEQLRASVLRNLQDLFAATGAEHEMVLVNDELVEVFSGLPAVRDSVLNFGIPPIAGRHHTQADLPALARGLERAVRRHEPRIRHVRATVDTPSDDAAVNPVTFVLSGELWGYPLPEMLRIRTVLDLLSARLTVEDAAVMAPGEDR